MSFHKQYAQYTWSEETYCSVAQPQSRVAEARILASPWLYDDFHITSHRDASPHFMDTLSVWLKWNNNIRGLTLVIYFFYFRPTANFKTSKHVPQAK
jgi:hypothetical protein